MKQIIVNAHHKDPGNTRIRTKPTRKWARRRHDFKGVSNFHLDQDDQVIRTYAGHPRCNYCFIVSHPRTGCKFKKHDLRNRIDRAVHPKKGLLSYKDLKNQYTPEIPVATLEQLPNEILEKICEYLTFKDKCRFGATNKRIQFVLTADKFWQKVSIPNHLLKYELLNKLINMRTQSLNIPWSSIHGEWPEYSHLVNTLSTYASNLQHLNISGFNNSSQIGGENRIIAILIAKSTNLKTLDLTALKLTLLSTIATTVGTCTNFAQLVRRRQ